VQPRLIRRFRPQDRQRWFLAEILRAQTPRNCQPGKPEQVEFVWKIIDPDGVKRDWRTGEIEPDEPDSS